MRPIDADALKKNMKFSSVMYDRNGIVHVPLKDIDTAIDESPTVGDWISVKDRLPEQKWIDYLVATRIKTDGTRGYNIAWLNDDNGVWKSNDEWICDGREIVTHWMPPPELPKEDTNEAD